MRPTRQGVVTAVAGVVAVVVGRIFGVEELYVVGAGFLVAVVVAVTLVALRTPRVTGWRWVHPSVLVAGDTGRVDLELRNPGRLPTPSFTLRERVRRAHVADHVAELRVAPLRGRSATAAGYHLPTSTRGLIEVGPLVAVSTDPLGIVRRERVISGTDVVTVAPRAYLLDMPRLGSGPLGRHLLARARRLGPGEFHSLREYVDGDEPRSIHWRASARVDDLLVRQHEVEGLRRVLVVLDADPASYTEPASFERGVTAAASVVRSAHHAELATRFVTNGGIDLRGPEVTVHALRVLAELQPSTVPFATLDRDPGEGVGLLVIITGRRGSSGWRSVQSVVDPTISIVPLTTDEAARGPISVAARSDEELLRSWAALVGASGGRRLRTEVAAS